MTTFHIMIAFTAILLISGIFSMFGKGGGSLYTPVLVILGVGVGQAISTALFLSLLTALVATIVFWRNKLVDFKFCSLFLPGTIIGSLVGTVLSSYAPKDVLLGIFAVFLYGAGFLMFFSTNHKEEQDTWKLSGKMIALVTAFSFSVGILSSLIGIGGGLLIFPFLVLYMKYGAQKAAGANSLIVTVSSLMGTIGHFASESIDYQLVIVTSVACIIGATIGSRLTVKASPAFVKTAFALIMWLFATQISWGLL